MIDLSVYNKDGEKIDTLEVDEAIFGGYVRYPLLKQAVVMYQANKHLGTAAAKGRSMVAGSGVKLFRQKGTGRARIGNIRTGKRVGGGVTFAKVARDFGKRMPKKQKKLARDSAILAKLLTDNILVVDELKFDKPVTKDFQGILDNLKVKRSCLVTISNYDDNLYKSARNIPKVDVLPLEQLNTGDICSHGKMLFTKEAFLSLLKTAKAVEA